MQETTGTLNLKIARLQQELKILQQRQVLSKPYPNHQAALAITQAQLQAQLGQLLQFREELTNDAEEHTPQILFNGDKSGQNTFFAAH